MNISDIESLVNSLLSEETVINISSEYNDFSASISCLAIDKITIDLPNLSLVKENLEISPYISRSLAHFQFNQCRKIDMLIGTDIVVYRSAGSRLL